MSETRIRELFAAAAEDLPVGPAPELASFVDSRRSRRRLTAVSVLGATAALVAAVVVTVAMSGDLPTSGPSESPISPVHTHGKIPLDCRVDILHGVTWEGEGPYRRTPQALGTLFTNPIANEYAVVESVRGNLARVALVRGNGTAWAELRMVHDEAKGWSLGFLESCGGRYVRKYWQHQGHLFGG